MGAPPSSGRLIQLARALVGAGEGDPLAVGRQRRRSFPDRDATSAVPARRRATGRPQVAFGGEDERVVPESGVAEVAQRRVGLLRG